MANFGPKPWTNTFGKNNLNFWIFQTSCFCSLESRFSVLEYRILIPLINLLYHLTAVNCVPLRSCARVIMIAIIK